MVLAALAFQPDEFDVGVDIFGVGQLAAHAREHSALVGGRAQGALQGDRRPRTRNRSSCSEISPLFHADKIRKPLLVLQGANDPRVIKPESDDIVAAVKKNGVPVEYIVFPDEGHGFTKKENQIEGWSAILEFLDKYLKGGDKG